MSDAEHTIVTALLQRPTRTADVSALTPEFFVEREARALFSFAQGYHRKRGGRNALDLPLARTLLERSRAAIAPSLLELVAEYEALALVSDAEWRDALASLVVDRQRALIREHGSAALEAVIEGDWRRAKRAMRDGLIAADDADLDDDRPADIRSPEEVQREREEVDSDAGHLPGGFDVGFPRITKAVSLRPEELTIVGGFAADGKAMRVGTRILTPSGWSKIETLGVGDMLVGRDGAPTKLTGVFPQGVRPLYRVGFSDGTSVDVDGEHLWAVKSDSDATLGKGWRVLTTKYLRENLRYGNGRVKWRVPLCAPVQFDSPEGLPVDPYVLGVLLGDGCLVQSHVSFTPGNDLVPAEVERILGGEFLVGPTESGERATRWSITTPRGKPNPMLDALGSLGVQGRHSWEKFVPREYLFASFEDRLSLLQGLIDTDGGIGQGGRPSCVFSSSSPDLSRGVVHLVRSLGGVARTRTKEEPRYRYKGEVRIGRPSYEVCFVLPRGIVPTRVFRDRLPDRASRFLVRQIISIEPCGRGEAICLSVDSPERMYVVDQFLVTHNTQLARTLVYNANRNDGANALYVSLEMSKREMKVLFVAQHAATLDPRGVDYRAILDKTATAEDKKLYHRALDDFEVTSHEDADEITTPGGRLHVWAPRLPIEMNQFMDRARAINEDLGGRLDIAAADYLELIEPSRDFRVYRLNLKYMVQQGKNLARELELWTILLHQISRSGRDAAEKRVPRHYLMRDLGETSGIERACDHFLWVYYDEDLREEHEAKVGIGKARKGDTILHGYHVMADYARANVAEVEGF